MKKYKWKQQRHSAGRNMIGIPEPIAEDIVEFLKYYRGLGNAEQLISQLIETDSGVKIGEHTTAPAPTSLFYIQDGIVYKALLGKPWTGMSVKCQQELSSNEICNKRWGIEGYAPFPDPIENKCPACAPGKFFEYREGMECESMHHSKNADGILYHNNSFNRFYVWCESCAKLMLKDVDISANGPFIPFASFPGLGEKEGWKTVETNGTISIKEESGWNNGGMYPRKSLQTTKNQRCNIISQLIKDDKISPEEGFHLLDVPTAKHHTFSDTMPQSTVKRERNDDPIKINVVDEIPFRPTWDSDWD